MSAVAFSATRDRIRLIRCPGCRLRQRLPSCPKLMSICLACGTIVRELQAVAIGRASGIGHLIKRQRPGRAAEALTPRKESALMLSVTVIITHRTPAVCRPIPNDGAR
jgi:ribosomal protein S27E